jgi:nicotinate-nucleotide pyrophosphorylase (carboxylating)
MTQDNQHTIHNTRWNDPNPMETAKPDPDRVAATVDFALAEDAASEDITADLIDPAATATAQVITREDAVICGRPWVDETFRQVDPTVVVTWYVDEGDEATEEQLLFSATGPAPSILTAERTALNFLQTLSATATTSRHYANLVAHTSVRLLDTRKTLPGLRHAQKYAVRVGGCFNHRADLAEAFLIKENHIIACGGIAPAINKARQNHPERRLEIEVESLDEMREALHAAPDWIMLDNFDLADTGVAVKSVNDAVKLEASGGIETDADLVAIAETGVHFISIGALTKHCSAVDLSMRFV